MRLNDLPILSPATTKTPKYRQIAALLEEYLLRADLPEGERFFSDRALAKRFGTTSVTISHSLNYLVSKGLLVRKAGSGTYIGSRTPDSNNKHRIGIVCHEMILPNDIYNTPILRKFGAFFEEHNFECISFKALPAEWRRLIKDYQLAGLLVFVPQESFADELFKLYSENVPVVSVGYAIPQLPEISFGTDHSEAVNSAMDHLCRLGHRKIALLYNHHQASSVIFERSYRQAMWANQLPVNPLWEIVVPDRDNSEIYFFEHQLYEDYWQKLEQSNNIPTAVIIENVIDAIAFYNFAFKHNLRIPEDISLIAFDDPEFASQLNPPLTVVAQDLELIAETAARKLLAMIEKKDFKVNLKDKKTCTFIERRSCCAIKQNS